MENKTRWPHPSVPFDTPPFQESGHHFAHPGTYTRQEVGGRAVLCDCHCGPMYYLRVSLTPEGDFVMCWVSDCGRCYEKSLGYFHLNTVRQTRGRIDAVTRTMALCANENCSTFSFMAKTRSDGTSSDEDKTCWYCFDCRTEFPHRNVRGLWERLLRGFRPSSYQECQTIFTVAFPDV
jgi:hypothetical protein